MVSDRPGWSCRRHSRFPQTLKEIPVAVDVLIACWLIVMAAIWFDGMKALERANAVASEACAKSNLALLDETVALAARQWVRDADGRWVMCRTYTFDYCEDGFSRASGFIMLHGYRPVTIGLDSPPAKAREEQGVIERDYRALH